MSVLVTGANGFIGSALCVALQAVGIRVRRALREALPGVPDVFPIGEIGPGTDWSTALAGIPCVVHLAARTHVLQEAAADPLAEYRRVNVEGTRRLAQQAARAGVRRLVFVSSIKVNGEMASRPITEDDPPHPEDAYGISKWEAEQALHRVSAETGLEVVILRPPLVYGPGVKGNFLRLMNLVASGVPLPLGAVDNRRSFIYTGNLASAIVKALDAPQAAGKTWLASDGEDVSTRDLVREIGRALGKDARLFPCPVGLLKAAAALAGKRPEAVRLVASLQLDCSRIRGALDWRPQFGLRQGLAETARWFYRR
jgi:nucleoside-diphosphate-sugar epimerase